MNIADLLAAQARERPDAPAIIERTGMTTFAQLDQRARRAASMLHRAGLRAGDAVLIFQPMSADLYTALLAVFRLGAVAMFLDPSAGRAHLAACCELQPPRALIASPRAHILRLVSGALRRIPRKFSIGCWLPGATRWNSLEHHSPLHECTAVASDTPALLTFTSGSTGRPKAAVRTHGFLVEQHRVLARSISLVPGEVDLATLPIFTLANLASGVTSVIPDADLRRPGFIDPAPVWRQIEQHRVTRCAASPAFFQCLLEDGGSLRGLRKIFTGGAPVFPTLLSWLRDTLPEARIEAVFGSTEAEPIAHIEEREISGADRAAMIAGQGLLAGKPVPEITLRILRDQWGTPLGNLTAAEFAAATVPPGAAGEIVVSGGHVLPGYLHGHGDHETKFRVDGIIWHRTGDAGWLDDQGRLWLLGRCSAKITRPSGILWPFAVECAADQFNEHRIWRAALIDIDGRCILAVESIKGTGRVGDEFKQALSWAELDEIRTVPRIPVDKRHNAKIDYPALRALLGGGA